MKFRFVILFLIASIASFAQQQSNDFSDRITYGGNVGFSFGSQTIIDISPRIGYRVTEQFVPGIALSYLYFKINGFSDSRYGGSAFARYFITEEVFLHAESVMTNLTTYRIYNNDFIVTQGRSWVNTTMIGGGYRSGIFTLSALYIINHNPATSPYGSSPFVVQGGIMF